MYLSCFLVKGYCLLLLHTFTALLVRENVLLIDAELRKVRRVIRRD